MPGTHWRHVLEERKGRGVESAGGEGLCWEVQVPPQQQWWELLINSSFSMKQEWFIRLAGGGQKRLLGDSRCEGNMNNHLGKGGGTAE